MIDKLVSASVIVGASVSAASVSGASPDSIVSLIASIAVACVAATLSRATVIFNPASNKNKVWTYELSLLFFCVLLSGALAYENSWSVGQSTTYGGGIGFIGAGIKPFCEALVKTMFGNLAASWSKDDPKDDTKDDTKP